MLQLLIVLTSLLLLGCETTKNVPQYEVTVTQPYLEPAPDWMVRQCPPLPKLNRKELPQAEAERQWSEDMRLYHECRTKHAAYARWIKERDDTFMRRSSK